MVYAPPLPDVQVADSDSLALDPDTPSASGMLSLHEVNVHPNQFVHAGEQLATLADLTKLYVEGRAFEQDATTLIETANQGWKVTAVLQDRAQDPLVIPGLDIVYVSNKVDPETRAFYFYVELPNIPLRDVVRDGHRFVSWRHKPGQRLELLVPIERWTDQIVLPVGAVAEEGPETFVFVKKGKRFIRRSVHIAHRRQHQAVLENDGSLRAGELVAVTSAHQLQMALQQSTNQEQGGDQHHGHVH
jgi:multidrug efflux pump subunit AcrA (membrane-fusion protein)